MGRPKKQLTPEEQEIARANAQFAERHLRWAWVKQKDISVGYRWLKGYLKKNSCEAHPVTITKIIKDGWPPGILVEAIAFSIMNASFRRLILLDNAFHPILEEFVERWQKKMGYVREGNVITLELPTGKVSYEIRD